MSSAVCELCNESLLIVLCSHQRRLLDIQPAFVQHSLDLSHAMIR